MSGRDGEPAGLGSTFGPAAARRARLPAAAARVGEAIEEERMDTPAPPSEQEPDPHGGSAGAARSPDGPPRRAETRRPGKKQAQRGRTPRPVVVRDPRQVDMILLAVLEHAPRSRAELLDMVASRSLGRFVPARDQVTHRLIYLERNRLLVRSPGRRRYRVTELGARVLNGRVRAWRQFVDGMDALIEG
ncbi:MAG: hypothetical protein J0I34_00545 [Pseudonocardia sp.]|uniref:PadR family transcriptional regulator n=1 Tax=unclassified Pseudonocardia TaxID=2619320 RepID=UPI001ACBA7E6|nr:MULTISPECIES: hypothetical protein [unclassified Pseudonocardia]MBN9107243.1 hypothetical protein [Pseudonocardia sp.]